jgi:superfamily II DNA or RNA helicase
MPSKHPSATQLISYGLYDDLQSFAQLEQRITYLGAENSKAVGDAFEIFIEGYLATHQKLQADVVWLVGQIPLEVRTQLNLPSDSKGIDGVFKTRIATLVPYQVKFRSQRAYITYTEVAPFLGLTERATDRIIFTNSSELAVDAKNRDGIRAVRGIDFDELTKDDLNAITAWLKQQPIPSPKPTPYPYQIEALSDVAEALNRDDRAHVVMASGTGKTLVALWAVEQLKPETVLVLLPSLTLVQQTLDEWSRHNSWGRDFTYLCVCSDPTVTSRDEYDPVRLDAMDVDFRVDTDSDEVRRFIERDTTNIKVVFSTYHSSSVVSAGIRGLAPLDVAVFDEAHKTTGPKGGAFAHCLSEDNIHIRKRLFVTATPRHYDIRHRDREGDFKIQSMDDPTVYGRRAHTLSFGKASHEGIICNYKVVISVVDHTEVNNFALKYGITLVKGDLIGAKWVANQIAIERAVEKTGARRVITFHSRVSTAKEFSSDTSHGIRQFLPDFSVFHVNGMQHSSERKQVIKAFREAHKSLITNARCLTEGIDVPAVDMVAFIDPRHSRIDIAQATGRAMRKPRGSDKTVGYIVVPLFLERKSNEALEDALARSDFSDVADVLNALQEQDEELVEIVRELQEARGKGEVFNPRRLAERIEVLGPAIELSQLKLAIFAEISRELGIRWDEWYGRLKSYKDRFGDCRVPKNYVENGYRLAVWVRNQRAARYKLSDERRKKLDELGFAWDPYSQDWDEWYGRLKSYKDRFGDCRVPKNYLENGHKLASWVRNQRLTRDTLSEERKKKLDELGFEWDPLTQDWEEGFANLKSYCTRYGHCRVPLDHVENGFKLGRWARSQRDPRYPQSHERRLRLEELGFVWDTYSSSWEKGFSSLSAFRKREGHCRVAPKHVENGYKLGFWVAVQRRRKLNLSEIQRKRLDELGFDWGIFSTNWAKAFVHLQSYKERVGNCRVPQKHVENGFELGSWVAKQRKAESTLSDERWKKLNDLGFVWDTSGAWEEGFRSLSAYQADFGTCRVPLNYVAGGFPLGRWVSIQRHRRNRLSPAQLRMLNSLGFDWDLPSTRWEEGYNHLKRYKDRVGDCLVPNNHVENSFKLGKWVSQQRRDKSKLSDEQRTKLSRLGYEWIVGSTSWEKGFDHLKAYKERVGNCRVPLRYVENGFALGRWAEQQRRRRRLAQEQLTKLNEIGFDWTPSRNAAGPKVKPTQANRRARR